MGEVVSKPTERAGAPLVGVIIVLSVAAACSTVYLAARADDQPVLGVENGALDNQSAKEPVGFENGALDNQSAKKLVVVGFRDEPDPVLIQELGGDILEEWIRIPAIVCSLSEKAIDALKKNPNIAYMQLDKEIHLVEPITDAMIPVMVGFRDEPDPVLIQELGGVITYEYTIIPTIACSLPAEAILVLQKNPKITHIELDGEIYPAG